MSVRNAEHSTQAIVREAMGPEAGRLRFGGTGHRFTISKAALFGQNVARHGPSEASVGGRTTRPFWVLCFTTLATVGSSPQTPVNKGWQGSSSLASGLADQTTRGPI